MRINIVSRCWCCDDKNEETIEHLFLTSSIAKRLWRQFAIFAERGKYKCNTDGVCLGNPGISAITFCIRNEEGNLVFAKAKGIRETTNMEAEITTIAEALTYCQAQNIKGVTIETDSLISQKMIQDQWKIP
ncbi:uncharacterized protein LOC124897848 [Capsicum annuum]|uniref:uncharacterized protein LOC124897848 n=1 Tax=Capsicum annuum TaxID=4072 RepID=UPI001FB16AD7|nr:uncharacterized protein LOC124897848 [Capsicum annuum]